MCVCMCTCTNSLSLSPSLSPQVRILVTHGIGFLSQCDKIIVMSNGGITEVGSYNELIELNGVFAELLHNYGTNEGNEDGL